MQDVQFMTAAEKEKVLRDWERFLKSGLSWDNFTKDLYNHLTQHCSFIAHYDRAGFFATYFESGDGKSNFLSQFDQHNAGANGIPDSVEYWGTWWCGGDYEDINREMISIATNYIPQLLLGAVDEQRDSDLAQARMLLERHGYTLSERR